MLAAASAIATTNVFAVDEAEAVSAFMHDGALSKATISAVGNSVLIVPANNNRVVKLYRMQIGGQGVELIRTFKHDSRVISAWFNYDSTRAFTMSEDGIERQWDVEGGRGQLSSRQFHKGQIR